MSFLSGKDRHTESAAIKVDAIRGLLSGRLSPQEYGKIIDCHPTGYTEMIMGVMRAEERRNAVASAPNILKPLIRRIPFVFF